MSSRSLCPPDERFGPSYLAALREGYHLGDDPSFTREAIDTITADLPAHLAQVTQQGAIHVFPDGSTGRLSPFTLLWFIEDDTEFLGSLHLRHELANDYARLIAGHVRYGIRPSRRNQGLGTQLLTLAKPVARTMGHSSILVVCREENHPSRRLIEKCRGVLESVVEDPFGEGPKRRYWVPL